MTHYQAAHNYNVTTARCFTGPLQDYRVSPFFHVISSIAGDRRGFMTERDRETWNQSVNLSKGLKEALGRYADQNCLLLKEVQAEALRDFIEMVRAGECTTFRATVKSGTVTTIWGERELLDEMRELAEQHRISYSAFVFNAFCLFLEKKGYQYDA